MWRTAPNGGCLVITIIMAIAQLAMGIVLVSLPKYGFAEDDYYSFSARRGVCEFQNVNDDGDSSASTWGVLHIVFGAWSTFWTWQALANLDKYNRIHRRGGNQNARARPNQAVDVHGEGTLIQSWNNIGRHGGRWQSIDRRVDHPRGPYRQYALEIYRNQDGTHGTVQLGRIQFKDQHGLEVPYQSHTINNERCHGNGGEHIRNLSNGGHGKWCTQLEYFPRNTPRFVFTFNGPVTIATVVLTSANDMPQRDPSQFALLGVGPVGEVDIEMVPLHLPGDIPPLPQAVVPSAFASWPRCMHDIRHIFESAGLNLTGYHSGTIHKALGMQTAGARLRSGEASRSWIEQVTSPQRQHNEYVSSRHCLLLRV